MPLLSPAACATIVIDAQPAFFESSSSTSAARDEAGATLRRLAWLVGAAAMLDIPAVVVEEGPERAGTTDRRVLDALPPDTAVLSKSTFSAAREPSVAAAVAATHRATLLLVGFETDTCIAQSTIEFLDLGYRVSVPEDAVYSASATEHRRGLDRLRQAGADITDCKSLLLEWMPVVDDAIAFAGRARERLGAVPFNL